MKAESLVFVEDQNVVIICRKSGDEKRAFI